MTTHYMEEADQLCDRIAIIDHGKIVALGSPAELKTGIGGDLLLLDLADRDKGDGLAAFLGSIAGVRKVSRADDGRWVLVVERGEEAAPRVLGELAAADRPVRSLELKKPSLDDVFLHYTGKALRENEGGQDYGRLRIGLRRARM